MWWKTRKRYYPVEQPLPKEEKWYCACGGNWRSLGGLNNHASNRHKAGDFNHGFARLQKHGTNYTYSKLGGYNG